MDEGRFSAYSANGTKTQTRTPKAFNFITAAELDAAEYQLSYLVEDILCADHFCMVAGGSKTLKTSIMVDLAISLATGSRFLGIFPVAEPTRVAMMSGESGFPTLQETTRRIADAAGVALPAIENLTFCDELPMFHNDDHIMGLEDYLEGFGPRVLMIDPAYLCVTADNHANMHDTGPLLSYVARTCQEFGCMLMLAHHARQTIRGGGIPQLQDMAFSGYEQYARQWILLRRQSDYQGDGHHELIMHAGGSMGHGTVKWLDVNEGTRAAGRFWSVDVSSVAELEEQREQEKEKRRVNKADETRRCNRAKMLHALRQYPQGQTMATLRDMTGLNSRRAGEAVTELVSEGLAKPCDVVKNNRAWPGVQPIT